MQNDMLRWVDENQVEIIDALREAYIASINFDGSLSGWKIPIFFDCEEKKWSVGCPWTQGTSQPEITPDGREIIAELYEVPCSDYDADLTAAENAGDEMDRNNEKECREYILEYIIPEYITNEAIADIISATKKYIKMYYEEV